MNLNVFLSLTGLFLGIAMAETELICKQNPIEIGIVLDSSSSIYILDYYKGRDFLKDFADQYEIGSNGARFAIISYGAGIYPEIGFNLTTYTSKTDLISAIGQIPHQAGLRTDTGEGIEYMTKELTSASARSNARKVMIVITDGDSSEKDDTKNAAIEARNAGITVFSIGVGPRVGQEELENIAGSPSRAMRVDDYGKLDEIKEALAEQTCIERPKPTTQPPKTDCGELNPLDIFFVYSPTDLGRNAMAWATSFVSQVVSHEDMDTGFRYAVKSGPCSGDEGFDFDEYSDPIAIKDRISSYELIGTEHLVRDVAIDGFSEARGGRSSAGDVAVIVAKPSTKKETDALTDAVNELLAQGIVVYIADPTGRGIEIDGTIPLQGRNAFDQAKEFVSQLCPDFSA